jgi:hypothetical protein
MWNYQHFPRVARNLRTRAPWLGMTGRFQKMWGDFGGIKPAPALEFECFRTQAMGGANSVGDQLHPRGTLDQGAYQLIGGVFAQCQAAEPFYQGAVPCPQVAIVCPHDPDSDEHRSTLVEEGLVALCQENHYDCALVNDADDLSSFDLLLLGEYTWISEEMRRKVEVFEKAGGKLIAAGNALFDGKGMGWGSFQNLENAGEAAFAPAYWRARPESPIVSTLGSDDRVIYERGLRLRCSGEVQVWADRVAPYFQRSDLRFCSHFQAPPRPAISGESAIVAGESWVAFADPIFSEYRKCANLAVARAFRAAVEHLIGPPRFGHGLKSTVRIYPMRVENDLHLTLLHYLPERRALQADIISERLGFGGQILRLPSFVKTVEVWPSGEKLDRVFPDGFALPVCEGRLLVRIPVFFNL